MRWPAVLAMLAVLGAADLSWAQEEPMPAPPTSDLPPGVPPAPTPAPPPGAAPAPAPLPAARPLSYVVPVRPVLIPVLIDRPLNLGTYITGGVLGTTLGFGIGHGIVGEYGSIGWVFTTTEVGSLALMVAGAAVGWGQPLGGDKAQTGLALMTVGALCLVGFHIWETIDIWVRPRRRIVRHRQIEPVYQVSLPPGPRWGVAPIWTERGGGLGVALDY